MLGRNKGITEQLDVVKLENDPSSVHRGHSARDDHGCGMNPILLILTTIP